jgi:hypothetical protein
MPDTRMLNLKPPEARQLLMYCASMRDANIVAAAYELNRLPEWVGYVAGRFGKIRSTYKHL